MNRHIAPLLNGNAERWADNPHLGRSIVEEEHELVAGREAAVDRAPIVAAVEEVVAARGWEAWLAGVEAGQVAMR